MERRRFITVGGTALGGLLLTQRGPGGPADATFSTLLRIEPDGRIVLGIAIPEIGQGVRTSLAMLVAEELDVPLAALTLEQVGGVETGFRGIAAGSYSVRGSYEPMRRMAATARDQLVRAAAERWGVESSACETVRGSVRERATGRAVAYHAIAGLAATLAPRADVPLRSPDLFRLIGRPVPNLDIGHIVTGRRVYGTDVRRPGQRYAVVARAPVVGGRLISFDDTAARGIPGVRAVVPVAPYGGGAAPTIPAGVAVVADNTWSAIRGRQLLEIRWDNGRFAGESTDHYRAEAARLLDGRHDETYLSRGDVDAPQAGVVVRSRYHLPFLAHVPMEPPACTVEFGTDRCEIWAPTQIPLPTLQAVARYLGWEESRVTLHVTAIGGGFGRRLDADFVLEAVAVARGLSDGGPVQVIWTREDDLQHGFFRPYAWHELEARLDAAGVIHSWNHRQAGTSRYVGRSGRHVAQSEFLSPGWPAALVPAFRYGYAVVDAPFDRGPLRAPGNNGMVFAVESFIDEVAAAAGRDPFLYRIGMLGVDRRIGFDADDPYFDTGRLRRVLQAVARASAWDRRRAPGVGLGIACAVVFGSYVAHVIEASVDRAAGTIRCHRVWSAIDCGRVVNLSGVRAQVEGAVVDGLSAALHGAITIEAGQVVERNFHQYRLLRMRESPQIAVELMRSDAPPTGAGEPPYPPVLPALANAVSAATGYLRLRELPFTTQQVRGLRR